MEKLLAENPFGNITAPQTAFTGMSGAEAIGSLIERIIQLLIIGAGIYALFNLVTAGYAFMSAGDDAKKVAGAWAKIYQTLLGLTFAAGSFVLAAIFGQLIFGDPMFILHPQIPASP